MAKKKPRDKKTTSSPNGKPKPKVGFRRVTIEHVFPPEQTAIFSNHMVVQHDRKEFHITFFEIDPPLILPGHGDNEKKFKEIKSVKAKCVARILVSADRMPSIINALKENYDKFEVRASGDVEEIDLDQSVGDTGE